jgi:SpoIID/LytB domain protein
MTQLPTASPAASSRRLVLLVVLAVVLAGVGVTRAGSASVAAPSASRYGSTLTIDGHGTYHAIGLGQWGALGYAVEDGWTSDEILAHYYGGTVASTVAESQVTMLLSRLNDAQTVVVHDQGGAVLVGDPQERRYATLVARESGPSTYDVWGRTDASVCPSTTETLSVAAGWELVATGESPNVTFRSATDDATTANLSQLLGVCEPSGLVRYYRGRIRALNTSTGSNRTINVVPMEMLLRSVVAWEMSPSWADIGGGRGAHALRAQAVAARSYILAYAWYSHARSCDNICVAYRGAASRSSGPGSSRTIHEDARANAAVDATAGEIRRRGSATGAIALTMYSASTGGWTAPASGLASFPPVADEGDDYRAGQSGGNPWHDWTRTVSVSTVESRWPSIGDLRSIDVTRNGFGDWGGRVTSVTLVGSQGSVTLSGDTFPRAVGLPSNWFRVRPPAGSTSTTSTTSPPTTAPPTTAPPTTGPTTPPTLDCGERTAPAVKRTLGTSAASGLHPGQVRVLADTRSGEPVGADCTLVVDARVRAGTTAVVVNVTAVNPRSGGSVTAYACGTPRPSSPTLHSVAGRSVSVGTIVAVGASRRLCVHSTTVTDLVVSSSGRFSATGPARFTPITPIRRLDTRSGRVVPAGVPVPVQVAGGTRVPGDARAVALTVHALRSTATGTVSVHSCVGGPSSPVLTVRSGETVANAATAALDPSGRLCLTASRPMHLLLDITGWYGRSGSSVYRATPSAAIGDTRSSTLGGIFSSLENRSVQVTGRGPVPTRGVVAVAGAVTVIDPAVESYVTVHQCGPRIPELSMVRNVPPASVASGSTVVGVSRAGAWCLRPGTTMHVKLDVHGWFEPVR